MIPEVWAPRASRVSLRVPTRGADVPLARDGAGWWRGPIALEPGERYGFVIDDTAAARPDPRSHRQPDGVHGLSAVFDPAHLEWRDAAWTGRQLAGSVIYELHVGTFTPEGTLDAAARRLDHLVDLGIDLVELLPVNAFNGTHNWGYDGVLWYAVHEAYGGPEAYQRFVDACHARGLGVIQDVVYNHLGPSGNYLPEFGPYLRDAQRTTWGSSVDLDQPEVRDYIVDNALMWLRDFHVDGLRLDAVHALHDSSPTHILQELAERVDALSAQLGRPLTLIAESDLNDARLITAREADGYGLTAQWSDDYHHALHVAVTGETTGYYADFAPLSALAKAATRGFFHDGTWSSFRGREHGRPIDPRIPVWRLVVFAQDHDQIGNRAAGDRLSQTLDEGGLAIAAVLTVLGPFTPMLFMGEEWAATTPWQFFTSHPEPELGEATARGRIEEFARMGWDESVVPDPQDPETFRRSKLRWEETDAAPHARMLHLYRELIALRRRTPAFTDPGFDALSAEADEERRWFRLRRGTAEILVNFGNEDLSLTVGDGAVPALATDPAVAVVRGSLLLPPRSAAVIVAV
ncbi:malto-oligosyltrehalose trehalohydrolase [Microbacterium sp. CFBP9034]|uniref:malto-oligosyltrehalose trehalohydrolase n=1 Tax=Microbacterium sp. CFBP9034 TaxID=3096540 RepID=UPI002A6B806B|nr:malto-oligosyltrehalose trehalohydrolase [Microbacterium sp. CFBP9034]MDY0909500.1 malto-oligosyltrehalose trehalohydrolase [Microbacterium sp. CFBP9034]